MATIASQVILHPTVSHSIKFASTTLGRDKTYRAVQYFARFYAWHLISRGQKLDAVRWNALKVHLATARKLLRLGKPLDHLQAALRASLAPGPAVEQITTIGRQLSYFGYLTYDAVAWANAVKFIALEPEIVKRVNKTSNRLWLAGIIFSLANALLKSARLAYEARKLRLSKSSDEKTLGDEADREAKLRTIQTARAATYDQFYIDVLDVWIPATNLDLVNLNDGVVGILGLVTSLLAWRKQWQATGVQK